MNHTPDHQYTDRIYTSRKKIANNIMLIRTIMNQPQLMTKYCGKKNECLHEKNYMLHTLTRVWKQ